MSDNPFIEGFSVDKWCDKFKNTSTIPMSKELSAILLAVMLSNIKRDVLEDMFLYKVTVARSEAIGLVIEQNLTDFISVLCKSPGDVTMYISLLRQEQKNGMAATLANFIELFPMGFPAQDELGVLWDAQKAKDAPLGNSLDINWWED